MKRLFCFAALAALSAIAQSSFAPAARAHDCCTPIEVYPTQSYRLVYRTVYDERQVTAYRIQQETVYDQQQITCYRDVWETEVRERRFTVQRPVWETSEREE